MSNFDKSFVKRLKKTRATNDKIIKISVKWTATKLFYNEWNVSAEFRGSKSPIEISKSLKRSITNFATSISPATIRSNIERTWLCYFRVTRFYRRLIFIWDVYGLADIVCRYTAPYIRISVNRPEFYKIWTHRTWHMYIYTRCMYTVVRIHAYGTYSRATRDIQFSSVIARIYDIRGQYMQITCSVRKFARAFIQ